MSIYWRLRPLLAFGLFLAIILQVLVVAVPTIEATDSAANSDSSSDRAAQSSSSSSLPGFISWENYTKMYNKNYSSTTQLLARQKIFMSKAMQAFVTSVKYMLNQLPYHLSINQFSDLMPEEGTRILSGAADTDDDADDDDEYDRILDDHEARRILLEELEEYGSDDETEEELLKTKSERAQQSLRSGRNRQTRRRRPKRSLLGAISKRLTLRDLVRKPGQSSKAEPANIRWIVPPSNEDYQPPEMFSQYSGAPGKDSSAVRVNDIPANKIAWIASSSDEQPADEVIEPKKDKNMDRPGVMSRIKGTISGAFSQVTQYVDMFGESSGGDDDDDDAEAAARALEAREINKQTMLRDWRDTGCIGPSMNQGNCMSCYAVSTMSYVEWAFCKSQHRMLTPLSTQYMIDCGPQYKMETRGLKKLNGCEMSFTKHAMSFVQDYGVELEAHMPYVARDGACPVAPHTPAKQKGYIRPNVRQSVRLSNSTLQLDLALKLGPTIIIMREPVDFLAYGGGMVNRCYPRASHAMLVVGNGFENGEEFLLIKNSFGTNWGINGYFKFQLSAASECVREYICPRVSFPSKKAQLRRAKAYAARKAKSTGGGRDGFADSETLSVENLFDVGQGGLLGTARGLLS